MEEYWQFMRAGLGGGDKGEGEGKEQRVDLGKKTTSPPLRAAGRESKPATTREGHLDMVGGDIR